MLTKSSPVAVGIFPYILKLLQTSATDLRQTLVFIWAKIVSWDMNAQVRGSFLNAWSLYTSCPLCHFSSANALLVAGSK
jgi:hypothetical protein